MTKTNFHIADNLTLPENATTQTFAFLARRGAGKTYGASKLSELMLEAKQQVVILDPVGNWYGLRLAADGKGKGFAIPVFGGEHGDIPLESGAGALIADLIVDKHISVVLDVSTMRKGQRKQFATDFAEQLFHRKKTARSPLHVFIEEAQVFVPQRVGGDEARMLGAFEDIIKLGRNYGIGATLISQRPQSVNKDALNQTEALFVMQTNGSQERAALKAWIVDQGLNVGSLVDELPGLPIGTAYVWSPSWLGVTRKVKIARKKTFDASATPTFGGSSNPTGELAHVDLKAIQEAMQGVVERAKENDPKALKAEIVSLRRQLQQAQSVQPQAEPEIVEVPVIKPGEVDRLEELAKGLHLEAEEVIATANHILAEIRAARGKQYPANTLPKSGQVERQVSAKPQPIQRVRAVKTPVTSADNFELSKSQQKIVDTLGWLETIDISPVDKVQLAGFVGQSPTGGGYANNLGKLRTGGYIEYPAPGQVVLLELGRGISDPPFETPTAEELQRRVCEMVTASQAKILRVLINNYPNEITKADLAEEVEQSATGGGFANNLGRLRTLGFIDYPSPGWVAALPVLFLE